MAAGLHLLSMEELATRSHLSHSGSKVVLQAAHTSITAPSHPKALDDTIPPSEALQISESKRAELLGLLAEAE